MTRSLHIIDPTDGTSTLVGSGLGIDTGNDTGLTYDVLTGKLFLSNTVDTSLYTVENSGEATLVGSLNPSGVFSGLTSTNVQSVPSPSTAALVGLVAILGLAMRRRSRAVNKAPQTRQ